MIVYNKKIEGFWYTPISEKLDSIKNPFRVKLRLLTAEELAELQDILVTRTASEIKNNYGMYMVKSCLKGITDWENIEDTEGKAIPISKSDSGTITTESLNVIPYKLLEDIGTVIVTVSQKPSSIELFSDK